MTVSAIVLGGLFGFAYQSGASTLKLLAAIRLEDLSHRNHPLWNRLCPASVVFIPWLVCLISATGIKTTHLGVVAGGLIFGIGFRAAVPACACVAASGSDGIKKAMPQ